MASDLFNPINLIAMLVILYLGLLANSVSTAVWFTQVKVRSGAFLLCCLCITDALFCLTLSILVLLQLTQKFIFGCYRYTIVLPFSVFGNTSRLWTVVLMAQRWVAVSRPFAVARLCSLRRQVLIVTCLLLLPLTFLAMNIYFIYIAMIRCRNGDISTDKMTVFFVYFPWLLPSWNILQAIAILMLGLLLLYSTCTIRNVSTIHPDNASRHLPRVAKRHMTVLVLCMAAFSLMDTFLLLFITLYMFALIVVGNIPVFMNAYLWATTVNGSINFLLYSCFGREFRSTLRRQWASCWTRSSISPPSSRITRATTELRISVRGARIENFV